MQTSTGRRRFLAGATALAAMAALSGRTAAKNDRARLILLGTGGGPRPRKASSSSAQAIVINGSAYVVD